MSKAAVAQPVSPLRQFWLRWRFHLNVLLILIPLGFMPRYFADMALFSGSSGLGEREIGEVQVGPWSLKLAEWRIEPPHDEGPAGFMKDFNAALCQACIPQVKATYLRIGKPQPACRRGDLLRQPLPHGHQRADPAAHPARRRAVDHHGRLGRLHAPGFHSPGRGIPRHRGLAEQTR